MGDRAARLKDWEHRTGTVKDGDYTLVEEASRRMVWRWGGYLFATAEDAERFSKGQLIFEDGPQVARQAFSHKRVDGRRIYVHLGSAGG